MTTTKTIVQIINEWLDSADIAEVSKRSYRTKLNLWFRWLNNIHYEVRRPTQQQVLDYKRHLESEGKSSLTVDSYITAVRLFYRYCVKMRYYEDITQGVRSSTKLRGYRKSPLSREDAMRLLDSISTERLTGKRDKLMIAMMLLLGFRTCEIERMDVGDIGEVYDTRVVNVQRKGRHDKAESVALTPYINELLQDYMSEREVEEWSEPLFISVRGERARLQRTTISEIVHDRLRAIGINDPHITAHSLRHTCACLLLADGVEMETVRDVLGHTSTNTTRLYVAQMQSQLLIRNSPAKRLESVLRLSHHP
jgi:site-specific recombinase XerD